MTITEDAAASNSVEVPETDLHFALNQAFGNISDDLILRAERLVRSFRNGLAREEASRSPFKGIMTLAARTDSGKRALQNYLLYQLGRRNSGDIWRVKGEKGENFAVGLSKALDDLEPVVDRIAQIVRARTGAELSTDQLGQVRMRVIQFYLGYIARAHVAVSGRTKH